MISEREIASKFSAIWSQIFPMLTPNFMREFNNSWVKEFGTPKPVKPVGHHDIIAEFAFFIAKLAFENNLSITSDNRDLIKEAFALALLSIKNNTRDYYFPNQLNAKEIQEGIELAKNISKFILSFKPKKIQFAPELRGYGIIGKCYADVRIDESLFEIKTVTRTFRSKDLKQLILYLALQSATGKPVYRKAGLYNPRQQKFAKFEIEPFICSLSGYDTSRTAFKELLDLFIRDVQIEHSF